MKKLFGVLPTGEEIYKYTIKSGDTSVEIISFGAAVAKFIAFGKDIVGGYDTIDGYLNNFGSQGATVGRVANRIRDARFTIDGVTYNLLVNERGNCLHGGFCLSRRVWNVISHSESSITLTYTSPDGEHGFPGNLTVFVTYTLIGSALVIDYKATSDKKTPVNLTNHSYFNLDGLGGDIKAHKMQVFADTYAELDEKNIPTGTMLPIQNTRYDFSSLRELGDELLDRGVDYDIHFNISSKEYESYCGKSLPLAVVLENELLRLSMYTDREGFQIYSGGCMEDCVGLKGNARAVRHGGICLEAQDIPNGVNRGLGIYGVSKDYTQTTVYKVEKK